MASPDIALVSLGTTMGLREADAAFADQIRAAGATCAVIGVRLGAARHARRTMALTDLVEGLAARRAAEATATARAVVYSTVTAALLQPPRPRTAVRFDGIAALNRLGPGGAWQRRRERTALGRARLLLPWSEAVARAAEQSIGATAPPAVVLPPPVAVAGEPAVDAPDVAAYAANPDKRGLELICAAWSEARPDRGRLAIGGLERDEGLRRLARVGAPEPPGVEWLGRVPRARWLAVVAGARAFLNASRFEDWGLAQMEALAAGTPLVTVPTPGANAALPLARRLAPELVAPERSLPALAGALRAGLALDDRARATYARAAAELLEPYREEAARRTVAEEVLPRLLGSSE